MKAKHTPGPWVLLGESGIIAAENGDGTRREIIQVPYGLRNSNWRDDANLMVAAPEMYEALLAMKRARETPIVDNEFPYLILKADKLLAAALKKVEGDK